MEYCFILTTSQVSAYGNLSSRFTKLVGFPMSCSLKVEFLLTNINYCRFKIRFDKKLNFQKKKQRKQTA